MSSNKHNVNHEDISIDEFLSILNKGEIKLKQIMVGEKSLLDGVQLKNTNLPKNILIGPLIKGNNIILPDGNTKLEKNDILVLLGKEKDISDIKALVESLSIFGKVKKFFQKFIN
jgi:NhaP-type Na+/H+ and K+/H+ antiporter